jgi:hypothetical protein
MWNRNDVTAIEYREGYVYHIRFDDGLEGDVDFSGYIGRGPIFRPLADLSFFRKARVEGGTIAWPNDADIAPESLYETIEKANRKVGQRPRERGRNMGAKTLRRESTLPSKNKGR